MMILIGRGAYAPLANEALTTIVDERDPDGNVYWTAEHLHLASRFPLAKHFAYPNVRQAIRDTGTPEAAREVAHKVAPLRTHEPEGFRDVAELARILRMKCAQHPAIADLLLSTGDNEIINPLGKFHNGQNTFWGMVLRESGWRGENTLGKLWMTLRRDLRGTK